MGHAVTGHQQFKAVQPRNKVFFHVAAPRALHTLKPGVVNVFDHFGQKSSRAGCRVENLHLVYFLVNLFVARFGAVVFGLRAAFNFGFAGVGNAVGQVEFGFQNIVNRPHNKVYHRFGRVPNAAAFAQFWVVFRQKRFVKMNNRVLSLGRFSKVLQQRFYIGCPENIGEVVHRGFNALVNVVSGYILKKFPQKRIGFWNEFGRFVPAEILKGRVVQPGGKHTVG